VLFGDMVQRMEDLSILWVAAVLIAVVACSSPLAGCSSQQPLMSSSGPPIASPSDTNIYSSGEITSSASEVAKAQSANPALNGKGTTGPTTKR
jgi:hypothetical protein